MKLKHELTFISCILIILASEIQCSLKWEGVRFNSTTHMRFPKESKLTLGSGSKPAYFPVIEYRTDYDPHPVLKCTAYTRAHDRCNFTLHVSEGTKEAAITKAYQFSDTKLAVAWVESVDSSPLDSNVRVTTVDLNSCSSVDVLNSNALGEVQFYPDSFELITLADRPGGNLFSRSFDVNGKQIDESTLPISSNILEVSPASTKSPSKGLFISTLDNRNTLSILYTNGKEIKRLVDIGNQEKQINPISHADESSGAICWINQLGLTASQLCECAQYDQLGNELWRNGTQCDGERPFGVRNLKGGGVVLLSYQPSKYDEVRITEMRPQLETLKSTVKVRDGPERWDEDSVKIMDFNEVDRTFSMYWQVSPRHTVTHTDLAFAKLSFPSKAQK